MLDLLTVGLFAGGGPSSLFMRTWAAGLAYGNGLAAYLTSGRIIYMAHRCPDPVETVRFVSGFARSAKVDADLVQASLAYAFADYGGADSFSTRGARIGGDLDGRPRRPSGSAPSRPRCWRSRAPPAPPSSWPAGVPQVLGRVLVGAGGKVAGGGARVALVVGPSTLLDRYEAYLKENGETDRPAPPLPARLLAAGAPDDAEPHGLRAERQRPGRLGVGGGEVLARQRAPRSRRPGPG